MNLETFKEKDASLWDFLSLSWYKASLEAVFKAKMETYYLCPEIVGDIKDNKGRVWKYVEESRRTLPHFAQKMILSNYCPNEPPLGKLVNLSLESFPYDLNEALARKFAHWFFKKPAEEGSERTFRTDIEFRLQHDRNDWQRIYIHEQPTWFPELGAMVERTNGFAKQLNVDQTFMMAAKKLESTVTQCEEIPEQTLDILYTIHRWLILDQFINVNNQAGSHDLRNEDVKKVIKYLGYNTKVSDKNLKAKFWKEMFDDPKLTNTMLESRVNTSNKADWPSKSFRGEFVESFKPTGVSLWL